MQKILISGCLSVLVLWSLSSCNVTNYYIKKTEKQYAKMGATKWMDELDSAAIQWRKVGNGTKNLVLLHGFGPMTELQWKDIVRELNSDFTIYIPDLIYFGNSTSSCANHDPRFIARQLSISLDHEKVNRCYVAGISYGGLISSIMASQQPEKIEGLILIDALSIYMDSEHADYLAHSYGYDSMNEILIPKDGKSLKTLFKISFYKPKKYPSWALNSPAKALYAHQKEDKYGLLSYLSDHEEYIKNTDLSFNGPVQLIWGQEDQLIPLSTAYQLKAFYPKASLAILPNVGHVANMENPLEVARIIKKFAL